MPAKVVSLKMPSLPSPEVRDRIELSSRVNQLREAGIEFDMKKAELDKLYHSALDDLRRGYAEKIDEINSESPQ